MSRPLELDDKRRTALERVARLRKVPMRRLLERAVDEFIERAKDEELLESSAHVARQTGLREKDAVEIVREWRRQVSNKT
jgi:pantoate kinase